MTIGRSTVAALVAGGAVLLLPRAGTSWGFEGHRFTVEQAIELLPDGMRPFYRRHRATVVEHSIDPDLWRTAGFQEESPRHFLDIDAYGSYPYSALPRDYEAAVQKFGREKVQNNGVLPWRVAEVYDRLVRAFERQKKGGTQFSTTDIWFWSAVLAHYVADAHVPFHAVMNHDGQLTGQHGIHARFEASLFERYLAKLTVRPAPRPAVQQPRDLAFDVLVTSAQLAAPILAADRAALGAGDAYDDAYFDRFFERARPILERRLAESASAIAAVLAGAWEQAGRPELPVEPPVFLEKVRRPRP